MGNKGGDRTAGKGVSHGSSRREVGSHSEREEGGKRDPELPHGGERERNPLLRQGPRSVARGPWKGQTPEVSPRADTFLTQLVPT